MDEKDKKDNLNENPESTIEELTKKIADLELEKTNLVGELKEDRTKRQDLQSQIEELQNALIETTKASKEKKEGGDVEDVVKNVVEKVLSTRDASKAKSNKTVAIEKFVNENKEFHPDNDPTGKKREALEEALKRFNTEGAVEVEEFYTFVKDAGRLLGINTSLQTPEKEVENPYSSTTKTVITPKTTGDDVLNDAEKRLIKNNGWTEERYLTLKKKNPKYMEKLLSFV